MLPPLQADQKHWSTPSLASKWVAALYWSATRRRTRYCCRGRVCADNVIDAERRLDRAFRTESDMPVLHQDRREATPLGASRVELQRILRLHVPVIVKLAERKLSLSEVMRLGNGAIIEFFKSSDEPLDLLINNKVIATGETVKIGENFGLRITNIGDVKQVIRSMTTGDR